MLATLNRRRSTGKREHPHRAAGTTWFLAFASAWRSWRVAGEFGLTLHPVVQPSVRPLAGAAHDVIGALYGAVMEQKTVAGEPLDLLQAAFRKIKPRKMSDGRIRFSVTLEPELGEPLLRALLRIEMELLDHDLAHGGSDERTTPQCQADAFVVLCERFTAALNRR
jgi:hypothetical protein